MRILIFLGLVSLLLLPAQSFTLFGFGSSSATSQDGGTDAGDHGRIVALSLPLLTKQSQPADEEGGRYAADKYGFLKDVEKEPGRYSECWLEATSMLKSWCADMDNNTKQRMALSLTMCHLEDAGRRMNSCPERADVKRCLKDLTDAALETYTNFYLYSTSFCLDIQQDKWQRQTTVVINELSKASIDTVAMLLQSKHTQQKLLERQETSLELQGITLDKQRDLQDTIVLSASQLEDLKSSLEDSFNVIGKHYDHFLDMQKSNMAKQQEMVETLMKANNEMRSFTEKMEREFAAEAIRFNFLRDVVSSIYAVFDFISTTWWLFCLILCLLALWTIAPQAVSKLIKQLAAVVVLFSAVTGLLRSSLHLSGLVDVYPTCLTCMVMNDDGSYRFMWILSACVMATSLACVVYNIAAKLYRMDNDDDDSKDLYDGGRFVSPQIEKRLRDAVAHMMLENGSGGDGGGGSSIRQREQPQQHYSPQHTPLFSHSGVPTPASTQHHGGGSAVSSLASSRASSPRRGGRRRGNTLPTIDEEGSVSSVDSHIVGGHALRRRDGGRCS